MRLVLLSDTHMRHTALSLERWLRPSSIAIHAGDLSRRGTPEETAGFLDWFGALDAEKVLVAGNWDRYAAVESASLAELCRARGISWLHDSSLDLSGLRLYGAPWTPMYRDMAFNRDPAGLEAAWERVPEGLDLLVTHGPPLGIRDRMFLGAHVGDGALRKVVLAWAPRLHVFGHIHEARGEQRVDGCPTRFLNVATCRLGAGVREPIVIDL